MAEQMPRPRERKIAYRTPEPPLPPLRRSDGLVWAQFAAGVMGGFAMTGLFVFAAMLIHGGGGLLFLILSIAAKIGLGSAYLAKPRWRAIGIGIMTSIALNALLLGAGVTFAVYELSRCHFN